MLNSYVKGLKLVLKSVNHLVFDGNGFKYSDIKDEGIVNTLRRYGCEQLQGQSNNSLRGGETLEYYIFDVYFTDESKAYLDDYMVELSKSIAFCGYGITNSVNNYNKAKESGLNSFELELNNICDYLYGKVGDIFDKVDKVYLPKEGLVYNIVSISDNGSIWREDDTTLNCEGYCNVVYTEILKTDTLTPSSVIDSFVVLSGFTLLQNCAKSRFVGVLDFEKEISYSYFKAILFANIVNGAFIVE